MTGPKRMAVTWLQIHLVNPLTRRLPGQAVIETVGRRSGIHRHTPVGGRLEGTTFWVVTEHGRTAGYVRNIEASPRVRVQIAGRWHEGTARLLPEDDARRRLRALPLFNGLVVRMVGTELTTLRIDLDPTGG
ncbi:MAG TPA: nitroreductase/quinone reductase family protein [Candidatus Dormibacteraeota bacterium]|jgi:deazaflavin-dependent oxidoreductase (nitroreductase family)|nr:nitroreductase/quinone reductase family protein [Candidatus Dormibacteraeota bacterium]